MLSSTRKPTAKSRSWLTPSAALTSHTYGDASSPAITRTSPRSKHYSTGTAAGKPLPDVPDSSLRTFAYVVLAAVLAGSIVAAFNHRKLNASIVQSSYVSPP